LFVSFGLITEQEQPQELEPQPEPQQQEQPQQQGNPGTQQPSRTARKQQARKPCHTSYYCYLRS
jgi:hypothetical protein